MGTGGAMGRLDDVPAGYFYLASLMIKQFKHAAVGLVALTVAGCANVGYYLQAVGGHVEVLAKSQPIERVVEDPATAPEIKRKLTLVLQARQYAVDQLGLPDNGSYRSYADLKRPFAVWNVFAASELSLKLKIWCFIMIGCVSYRGYFNRERASAFAARLREQGHDVYVGGAAAYSTLGWFSDPMLNTVLARSDVEIAGVLFHELAHQLLYVEDDTAFNESFAVTVELEGVRRWLASGIGADKYSAYQGRSRRREEFVALILKHRNRLARVYESNSPDDPKRERKAEVFAELREAYAALKQQWSGYDGFDKWMAQDLNNAHLASIGTYHQHVAAFHELLARHKHDLPAFYRAVTELARLPKDARQTALDALSSESMHAENRG